MTAISLATLISCAHDADLPEVADPEPELPENTDDATRNWLYGLLHD